MAATVAALAVFTFVAPDQTSGQDVATVSNAYSAETLILDEGSDDDEMTYEQVLTSLYGSDDDVAR
jgi:hypothetical protein